MRADRIHLYSIISNLVDNAIKYADKEPEITIRAVVTEGKTQIRVQDNGPGIPEQRLDFFMALVQSFQFSDDRRLHRRKCTLS